MRVSSEVLIHVSRYTSARVVAVSKSVGAAEIREAYSLGYTVFGENRIQDALPKLAAIDLPIEWHFVGRLQTNKVRKAIGEFALVHSLDSRRLASVLSDESQRRGLRTSCLLQVSTSGEASKQGISPDEAHQFLTDLEGLTDIEVVGLMTMAPHAADPETVRPVFRRLRRLFEELSKERWKNSTMRYLSMGMSNDYRIALDEGANLVRVGSAIFLQE